MLMKLLEVIPILRCWRIQLVLMQVLMTMLFLVITIASTLKAQIQMLLLTLMIIRLTEMIIHSMWRLQEQTPVLI